MSIQHTDTELPVYAPSSWKLNAVPTLEVVLPPALSPSRQLIALVGKKNTGKHTYLTDYYNSISNGMYEYLAYETSLEQNGIHPHEQVEYINQLKICGGSVLHAPTHNVLPDPYMFVTYSPYILDGIGWDEAHNVIFFHRCGKGRFYRGSLLCNPTFMSSLARMRSVLTLGQFWYTQGEAWLEEYGEDVTDMGLVLP